MAISRTIWIDDDGSGTTGTVINNAAKTLLYDQIDAAAMRAKSAISITTVPGGYNNWAPAGGAAATVWLLNTASGASLITGIVADVDMTQHLIVIASSNPVTLYNANAGSTVGNQLLCPGYANYVLQPWYAAWVIYVASLNCWLVQKA